MCPARSAVRLDGLGGSRGGLGGTAGLPDMPEAGIALGRASQFRFLILLCSAVREAR